MISTEVLSSAAHYPACTPNQGQKLSTANLSAIKFDLQFVPSLNKTHDMRRDLQRKVKCQTTGSLNPDQIPADLHWFNRVLGGWPWMGMTEKIYEFFFLAGNTVLSAVRYTEVILKGMQRCIISCQMFLCLFSFELTLWLSLSIRLEILLSELKTDSHPSSPTTTAS